MDLEFLTIRPQFVLVKSLNESFTSSTIVTNTGAPQGTVLAPTLFSIYTDNCRGKFDNIPIIKYADDTSIQALIKSDDDLYNYKQEISNFVNWCQDHYLQLNVKKTKELIFDFRIKDNDHIPVDISNEQVERVLEYKYLGVLFDEKLEWHSQANKVQKKINQRMYFMRKLHSFNIDNTLLSLFYQSCVLSILNFCLSAWGGNTRNSDKRRINSSLRSAGKMMKHTMHDTIDIILGQQNNKKLHKILKDKSHPLHQHIHISVRSGRLIHLKARTTRHLHSFMPAAVRNFH